MLSFLCFATAINLKIVKALADSLSGVSDQIFILILLVDGKRKLDETISFSAKHGEMLLPFVIFNLLKPQ